MPRLRGLVSPLAERTGLLRNNGGCLEWWDRISRLENPCVISRWINTRWYNVTTLEILGSKFLTPLTMRLILSLSFFFSFSFQFEWNYLFYILFYYCTRVLQEGTTLLLFFTFWRRDVELSLGEGQEKWTRRFEVESWNSKDILWRQPFEVFNNDNARDRGGFEGG